MLIVSSKNGVPIRLTGERWQHIVRRHPEMDGQRDLILKTPAEPDTIVRGDFGELLALRFDPETPLAGKFVVVVYREVTPEDGFVLTAYFSSRPLAKRGILWNR